MLENKAIKKERQQKSDDPGRNVRMLFAGAFGVEACSPWEGHALFPRKKPIAENKKVSMFPRRTVSTQDLVLCGVVKARAERLYRES
jgi:hypothetical protein